LPDFGIVTRKAVRIEEAASYVGNIDDMKWLYLLCGLIISQPSLIGVEIRVGTTRLFVPVPEGFSLVTSNIQPYAEVMKRFVPPMNEQFALFVPAVDAAAAARGEMPQSERNFNVQTSKKLVQAFVSSADFAELKRTLKTQNADGVKKAEAQIPGFLKKANEGIAQDYNINLNLALDQVLPLPPHYESGRGLGYSMFLKYKVDDENGRPLVFEVVGTATFVHVQGKVLFLYIYAEKSALQWCREQAQRWAEAIMAANPSTGDIATRERSRRRGFDWGKVGKNALIGAVIGGIIGGLNVWRKRKGNKTTEPNQ